MLVKKKKKVPPRWKKKHPAARVSRPWGVIVKQNKSFWDVFFYFFILRAGYQQQPRRLCVCLRVCARLGGGGGFRWSKCWEVCAQQVGNVFCELEGSVIQFIYKPWKKKCSNIIPPYGHYCKGILNQRSGGGKKKKKKENIQKCREILERAKRKHTNQKQTNPEASIWTLFLLWFY